jgi:hypothetical protein
MRGAWVLIVVACGRAPRANAPMRGEVAPRAVAAVPPAARSPDEELAAVLPLHDPSYAPFDLKTAVAHVALSAGPVPGAPELDIVRIAVSGRCGGERVITLLVGAPGPAGADFANAMIAHSPTPQRIEELRDWSRDAIQRARPAFDRLKQLVDTSSGRARVEASARLVLIERHYVDAFLHMSVPPIAGQPVSTWPSFCEAMANQLSPSIHDADDRAAACRKDAADAKLGPGWWDEACAAR